MGWSSARKVSVPPESAKDRTVAAAPGRDVAAARQVQGRHPCSGRQLHHRCIHGGAAGQAQSLQAFDQVLVGPVCRS